MTLSFHPILNRYYRSNKLGRRYKSSYWYRSIIKVLWQLHHQAWIEYCDNIHTPPKLTTLPSPAKITLLTLVSKYKLEVSILPKHKKIFFDCTKLQYRKWSTKELQRWLSTARKIIQRYKLNSKQKVRSKLNPKYTTIIDTNINLHAPTNKIPHTIIKAKKTNHLKESTITKYYNSIASTINHTNPASPIPSKPNNNIASGTLHNNGIIQTHHLP